MFGSNSPCSLEQDRRRRALWRNSYWEREIEIEKKSTTDSHVLWKRTLERGLATVRSGRPRHLEHSQRLLNMP
jgi:hypothetical protein